MNTTLHVNLIARSSTSQQQLSNKSSATISLIASPWPSFINKNLSLARERLEVLFFQHFFTYHSKRTFFFPPCCLNVIFRCCCHFSTSTSSSYGLTNTNYIYYPFIHGIRCLSSDSSFTNQPALHRVEFRFFHSSREWCWAGLLAS